MAADYIAQQFHALGLRPYEQETFNPYQQTQCLTAHFADGSTREYCSGVDFYPLAVQWGLHLEGEVPARHRGGERFGDPGTRRRGGCLRS